MISNTKSSWASGETYDLTYTSNWTGYYKEYDCPEIVDKETLEIYLDAIKIAASEPDWEVGIYSSDMASGTVEKIAAANNGMAVGAHSQNPERALMFIELCYQDEEIYDLVMYGLEGVTYEADKEAGVKWNPEGVDPSDIGLKNLGMGVGGNKEHMR